MRTLDPHNFQKNLGWPAGFFDWPEYTLYSMPKKTETTHHYHNPLVLPEKLLACGNAL